jgi:type IV pilus assembly protein PilW
MCTERRSPTASNRQSGLSIVELLVAMAIGLIGIVIIFQMLAGNEARKRTTTAGSDAQISGVIGLTALERDIREAGYGFSSAGYDTSVTPVMGCTVSAYDSSRPTPAYTFTLAPVQIVQGSGAASDSIIVLKGASNTIGASLVFTASTDTTKKTQGRGGIYPRDRILVGSTSPLQCQLVEISSVSNADGLTIDHATGSYTGPTSYSNSTNTSYTARFNNPVAPVTFTAGYLFNMGREPKRYVWSVQSDGRLVYTNDLLYVDSDGNGSNDVREVTDNVVSLQAEYGVDANNDGKISTSEWTSTNPATGAWGNVFAIRVGLLVRSAQFETAQVTTTVPSWSGGQFTITNLDGSASATSPTDPANNWRNYRYRVFESVIPLRNMLWGTQISP